MTLMRLQRALARAGVASRRKAEDLIRAGRVRVDGTPATIGMSVDPGAQKITVDGRAVRSATRTTWLALNKPIGFVVSRSDPEGRRTVFGLLPKVPGLTYVGRLDVMTSGLLLLTTDGAAAHRLMHPRYEVPRSYWLAVHGADAAEVRAALAQRIVIDGRAVRVVDSRVRPAGRSVEVEITLAEGRQRIVRRITSALPALAALGTIEWKIGATGLHWHGQHLLPRNTQVAELAGLLFARGVRAIQVNPGVTPEHWLGLFSVAVGNVSPDDAVLGQITVMLGRRASQRLSAARVLGEVALAVPAPPPVPPTSPSPPPVARPAASGLYPEGL